jgi:hypothetical protein
MTATATLRYTSSRAQDARDAMARVAAARRVTAEREAREARAAQAAQREADAVAHNLVGTTAWVDGIKAAGAVEVGTKVCLVEGGKWRTGLYIEAAAESLARWIAEGHEVEAWGLDAAGEYVGEVLGVW